jgi:membrane-bound serine protease (ClpP class)
MGPSAVIWLRTLVAGLSLDAALILLTLGIALIYYELNRPGTIVPGCVGLVTALLSLSVLGRHGFNPVGATLILSAVALLTLSLVRPTPMLLSFAATVALIFGLRWLPSYSCCESIHTSVAVTCGLSLGMGTWVLAGIALRARTNKANGSMRTNNKGTSNKGMNGLDY